MRNRILKNLAAVLEAVSERPRTRVEIKELLGEQISNDALTNLMMDLNEMGYIEKIEGVNPNIYRIGLTLALIWRRALDAEKKELDEKMERINKLVRGEE